MRQKKLFQKAALGPALAALCLSLWGCAPANPQPVTKTGLYFDTVISITLYGEHQEPYIDECFAMAQTYESYFSNTLADSDISRINRSPGIPVEVHDETVALLQEGIVYGERSGGAFDITVGALSELWQFGHKDFAVPAPETVANALASVDYRNIQIDGNKVTLLNADTQLDLGGIAKGYIADKMKEYLNAQGVKSGLINLGGNVLALGPKESGDGGMYTIALQKPFAEDGEPIASLKITDQSVVTSGTYQRYEKVAGRLYHHILDTTSGYPCQNGLSSVTILSDASTDGDALSTMVFLMGLEQGLAYVEQLEGTEAVFITEKGDIRYTSGIGREIPFTVVSE